MNARWRLRPVRPDDREFLYQVYASTRQEELTMVDWDAGQKEAFLRMQFSAQDAYYHENYIGCEFSILLLNDEPAGRLYLHRRRDEIRIVDITLLPPYRNQGVGAAILRDIMAQGVRAGLPVSIHVEMFNPAQRLYTRLGFQKCAEHGVYWLMEWRPSSKTGEKDSC